MSGSPAGVRLPFILRWGSSAIREVEETIRAICKVEGNDGIFFDGESVEGTRIKEEDEYEDVRVKFHAVLAGARIPMQVDIGFGDAVYPEPEFAPFPVLLPMEPPVMIFILSDGYSSQLSRLYSGE